MIDNPQITNQKYIFSTSFSTTITGVLCNKPIKMDSNAMSIELGLPIEKIAIPEQIHSNHVKFIKFPGEYIGADGLITNNSNIILLLKVADCTPIYLFDKRLLIFGLVHSGWRGTVDKIIINAINCMLKHGSNLSDILISLGPAIGICCYEVGDEVAKHFDEEARIRQNNSKWRVGIHEQIVIDLIKFGLPLSNINKSNICTFESNDCQSYRRDGINAGRMLGLMGNIK